MKLSRLLFVPIALLAVFTLNAATDDVPDARGPRLSIKDILPRAYFKEPNKTPPPEEIKDAIDKFFTGLKNGDTAKAYQDLAAGNRISQRTEQIDGLVKQTEEATGLYGKLLGYELYDNYSMGSSMLVLTYMTNLQLQPLRWRFVYYKAEKKWELMNLRCDDVIDVLVE